MTNFAKQEVLSTKIQAGLVYGPTQRLGMFMMTTTLNVSSGITTMLPWKKVSRETKLIEISSWYQLKLNSLGGSTYFVDDANKRKYYLTS